MMRVECQTCSGTGERNRQYCHDCEGTGWLLAPGNPAPLSADALDRALVELRRWMPGHSGRIGNETFFVCREKDDGEVEWLAKHPTAEAMRDDLDRRTVEAVIKAAMGGTT